MSKQLERRDDLQLFAREQIIGPGAFNKRYFLLNKWADSEFTGKDINTCNALDNVSEVISEVPAYQYSSAILFPISNQSKALTSDQHSSFEENTDAPDDELLDGEKTDDENFNDDKTESISSKNQNYPNTCGIAFAVNADAALHEDLSLEIEYRTYKKLDQSYSRENRLAFFVAENQVQIEKVISSYFSEVFLAIFLDKNLFVYVRENVDINLHLYSLDYNNLQNFVSKDLVPKIDALFKEKKLYEVVTKEYDHKQYSFTILYTDQIYELIVARLRENSSSYDAFKELISLLEVYNQVKEIVTELKTIYRKSSRRNRPTPIWESKLERIRINLEKKGQNKTVQRGLHKLSSGDNLYLNYQYLTKYNHASGLENVYVRLIVVNKNVINIKDDEPPQLNKKDEANKKSFFGIKIRVEEIRENTIVAYNPPNLLDIDEEDNLNKLLYRNLKDFGEGYNTSVTWGKIKGGRLSFVSTDFLPEQDTINIDYKPSRFVDGKVKQLIDDRILSFRDLSILNSRSDNEILNDLSHFVLQYGLWIERKKEELDLSQNFKGKPILYKQLRGCEKDFKRLKRNIALLKSDSTALAAFRVMNTAMFMQLHHSIQTKAVVRNQSSPYIPSENTTLYYQNLKLEKEYSWRSFQLAFVLLNIDAFVKPNKDDDTVADVFGTGWPERNEVADLVWFPTGGGKTEAYLGLIAFVIAYRRFKHGGLGNGTTVLMRYTLRLLTLQQFQRATLLICALETMRKDAYVLPNRLSLGDARITIGLFVGKDSLPNKWKGQDGMFEEISNIKGQLRSNEKLRTRLPHTTCPWCGGSLFVNETLPNIFPRHENEYGIDASLRIVCNSKGCTFHHTRTTNENKSLPFRLFDEDIYKFPPTLLFGTVDKFAALANRVSTGTSERNQDSRRIFGRGKGQNHLPPELIIQDELHLLLGPLGSAVGLFEKAIDECCSYNFQGARIRPKVITSTATTRNTDKQIFALFNRRSEIFPKQGIEADDSFFACYKRKDDDPESYESNRRYVGVLPVGKTQVWMQLRLASIFLVHRIRFLKKVLTKDQIFSNNNRYKEYQQTFDYYHTLLSYFNSLKEVGKTQSQLGHYLPGDVNLIYKNTVPWDFLDKMIRDNDSIHAGELTGRLTGEEVKTSLSQIEKRWEITKIDNPPEFVISTNMISVGIDVSRFNAMIVNSMPRNTAEYIQASSRVARDREGIVFTVHHPFRSRDISHYQRFKEFHEKFYGYVEPISVTPFANKALERYLAMYLAVIIRHDETWGLQDNGSAKNINEVLVKSIKAKTQSLMFEIKKNAENLANYLRSRADGLNLNIDGIIGDEEYSDLIDKIAELLESRWLHRKGDHEPANDLFYRDDISIRSLFAPNNGLPLNSNWNVKQSLREIAPSTVIKTVQQ